MAVDKFLIEDDEAEFPAIARLIELGRQKSFVTLDDILHFFPEAEQDVEQLEEAFSALLSAGIPFMEDAATPEPTEDELVAVGRGGQETKLAAVHELAPTCTVDTPTVYFIHVNPRTLVS